MNGHANTAPSQPQGPDGDAYYRTSAAVETLDRWYKSEKEEAFIDFVLRDLKFPPGLKLVEIGGGTGLHGIQMWRRFEDRYLHTDLSVLLVESARRRGLKSKVVDGLASGFADASVGGVLLVGTSTLVWDEAMRTAQLRECSRILAPGGICILVTSTLGFLKGMHCLNRRDSDLMAELGLLVTARRRWGILPRAVWSRRMKPAFEAIERVCSSGGLGIRQIVVARKRPV